MRRKRLEHDGFKKHRELNSNIKRCMKKAKENRIGDQCTEIEENLRKSNSKRAYELIKFCPRSLRKMPHRRATDTEPIDRILL